MTYQQELSQDRYAQAVLSIKGKFSAAQLGRAAHLLWLAELERGKFFGEQHLLQEARRILREIG